MSDIGRDNIVLVQNRKGTTLDDVTHLWRGGVFVVGYLPPLVEPTEFPGLGIPGEFFYFERNPAESGCDLIEYIF